MVDLGKNRGSKESDNRDNRDKSLHGLIVALAIAGAIAGSAILFAYASSDGSLQAAGTATSEEPTSPEPIIIEKVIEKPVYIESIRYINQTVEVEKPVYIEKIKYINHTVEIEKPVYINRTVEVEKEVEKPVYIYINNTEDSSQKTVQPDSEQKDKQEMQAMQESNTAQEQMNDELLHEQDAIPEHVLDLLDNIVDYDEDEKENDDGNKGKGNKHNDHLAP